LSALIEDPPPAPETHESGERIAAPGPGTVSCVACGYGLAIDSLEPLPECPNCHGQRFKRAKLFDTPTLDAEAIEGPSTPPEWLTEVRAELERAGRYLAFEDEDGDFAVLRLATGWTRIGRSGAADLRLDDATVSRRHALVVLTDAGDLRALDDRSLNGLFVNGERVEWAALADGDELEIGRFRLYVLEA
jgi:FHA domain/Zinc-ribbon containing domain